MPQRLRDELRSNFEKFESSWPIELGDAQTRLHVLGDKFLDSYIRISSIQAWRTSVIVGAIDPESEAFFFEAQNDLLTSHCLSRCGSFRQALKALRSAIDNFYFSLYYKDHPVELNKWLAGNHKLSFSELQNYFEAHPLITNSKYELTGLDTLKPEYSTLSKAVHGSAKRFRMTKNLQEVQLWSGDAASVGQWLARERIVISSINLLLIHLFRESIQGAKNLNLRTSISLVISEEKKTGLKEQLGVVFLPA